MARNAHPEQTVNRILDVAMDLFLKKGYDYTSIQDIINGLGGLSKGAVYHHFKSKDEILSAAIDRQSAPLFAQLKAIRDEGSLNGAQKLQALFEVSITGPQMKLWAGVFPDVDVQKNARLLGWQYQSVFEQAVPYYVEPVVSQGMRDGSIRTKNSKFFSEIIVLLANLWVSPMFRESTSEQLAARIDYYVDLVFALSGVCLEVGCLGKALETHRHDYHKHREQACHND